MAAFERSFPPSSISGDAKKQCHVRIQVEVLIMLWTCGELQMPTRERHWLAWLSELKIEMGGHTAMAFSSPSRYALIQNRKHPRTIFPRHEQVP